MMDISVGTVGNALQKFEKVGKTDEKKVLDERPRIEIEGGWLRDYGFEIGDDIVVDVFKNHIIIEKVNVVESDIHNEQGDVEVLAIEKVL